MRNGGAPGDQQQWKVVSSHRNRRTSGRNGVTGVHRELELAKESFPGRKDASGTRC